MNTWPDYFNLEFQPAARQEAMVYGPQTRFTVLTSRLIRLEYSRRDRFEDRASQAFWHRQQPVPEFQVSQSLAGIEITTGHLHLRYHPTPKGFRPDTLSIELREPGTVWHYGHRDPHNLRGTARTLDGADGRVHLEPGLISRSGWAVVDDSASLVFDDRGRLVAHEAAYPALARQLGVDPTSAEPVPFNIASPEFATAYFKILHHPLEAQGVDFWWIDWQQGTSTRLAGLDPLWWLNHLHFYDLGRGGQKRPVLLSRWGGLGSHRYPIGFSGDAITLETCRALLRAFGLDSSVKYQIDRDLAGLLDGRLSLMNYSHDLKDTQLAALASVIQKKMLDESSAA